MMEQRPLATRENPESNRIEYKNPEGYADPTPYDALKRIQRTDADINALRLNFGCDYCPWCGAKMDGERRESE